MAFRVGIGYDVHQFRRGRKLVLGGVEIPFKEGLYGHSDADVICHAIGDALLGACGLDDIGEHFPVTAARYKGIASTKLLKQIYACICKKKYTVINVDCTIIGEKPNIAKYRNKMKKTLMQILNIKDINIKATTNEGLGFIGQGKGLACFAVVLLQHK